MKKLIAFAVAISVALSLGAVSAVSQDDGNYEHMFKCNLKTIKNKWYCETDYAFPPDKEIVKPEKGSKSKKPTHSECKQELVAKKACIQIFFHCPKHQDERSRRQGKCKQCRGVMEKVVDMQPYYFQCLGCGGRGDTKRTLKHQTTMGHDKMIRPMCGAAGQWPHNTKRNPDQ